MEKLKEYKVIQATSLEALEKLVNELIAKGWIPQGGLCESGKQNFLFFQAMVSKL